MPNAEALLKKLRINGIPVAIVTNGQTQSQRGKIVNAGLDKLVDQIVISEEFGQRKPDAAIFNQAFETLGVTSVKSWFIGDNPEADIIGANLAGCNTIWLQRYLDWPADHANCFNHKAANLDEVADLLFSEFELVDKL
jgi:putative hydrolase of the HAD superfamily